MSIANKRIFPDQQFAEVGAEGWPARPFAPDMEGQSTAAVMAPEQAFIEGADVVPMEDASQRLYVPLHARVAPSPPPRLPKIEPPADLVVTYVDAAGTGLSIAHPIDFPAHSVQLDNYTNQWLWLPAARRWVPPYIFGAILPLLQWTEVGEIRFEAPPTFTSGALHATQYIVSMWCAVLLGPSAGAAIAGGIA